MGKEVRFVILIRSEESVWASVLEKRILHFVQNDKWEWVLYVGQISPTWLPKFLCVSVPLRLCGENNIPQTPAPANLGSTSNTLAHNSYRPNDGIK